MSENGGMTIIEFLEARIDEDEARAFAANAWASHGGPTQWIGQPGDRLVGRLGAGGPHIAAWSPHRVLAECAAKRSMIDLYRNGAVGEVFEGQRWVNPLEPFAAIYKDHPDYQQEWSQ
jgi:hypothetical protein